MRHIVKTVISIPKLSTISFPSDSIDVLDDCGLRKGYTLSRKEVHEQGAIHRAVHLYIFDQKGVSLLLQKRSPNVEHYPNKYSISVVGHVNAGEYSYAAVQRELMEELGMQLDVFI